MVGISGTTVTVNNLGSLTEDTTVTIRVKCAETINYLESLQDYTITIKALPYSENLIEYWPLQSNLQSGLNNSTLGTLRVGDGGTPNFTGGGFNIASGGAGLKSSSNSYTLPNNFTFVMEIYPTALNQGLLFGISTNPRNSDSINSIGLFSGDQYRIWNGIYGNSYANSDKIKIKSWNRIVVTGNSSGWTVYCNGTNIGSRTDGRNNLKGTFFIGRCYVNGKMHEYSYDAAINGKIRNCALYNRVLTSSEIKSINFE